VALKIYVCPLQPDNFATPTAGQQQEPDRRGGVGVTGPIGFGVERYRESRDLGL
jgi:hypothetical protein